MKKTLAILFLVGCILASVMAFAYTDVNQYGTWTVTVDSVTAIAGSNPCYNPTATLASLSSATSGTFTTQVIALSGTKKIYICSLSVIGVSGTTPTFSLVQGTGSNCASNQGTILQDFSTTAGALYTFAFPVAVTTAGYALCYKDSGTTPVQNFTMTYIQQ